MKSLLVLCAVLVVDVALPYPNHLTKRSLQPVAYNAPAISHQSRFDVKTSQVVPASIADEAVATLQARALAPFNNPSSVSHQTFAVPSSVVSPVASVPLASQAVFAGQVPTLYAGGSAVTQETRYDTASGPYVPSGQVFPSVQVQQVQPVIAPW